MTKVDMSDVLDFPQNFEVCSRIKQHWDDLDNKSYLTVQVAAVENGMEYTDHENNEYILPLWESHRFPHSPAGERSAARSRINNQSHISSELDLLIDGQ